MAASTFFTALAGVIAVIGLAVFLFGIPSELKRKLERSALKTMGENKLSYMAKGTRLPQPYDCIEACLLTRSRPNQQHPHLRQDRSSPAEEGSQQPCWRRVPEPTWRGNRRGCRPPDKPAHRSLICWCLQCGPRTLYRILCRRAPAQRRTRCKRTRRARSSE
jgi:hypothetical protein